MRPREHRGHRRAVPVLGGRILTRFLDSRQECLATPRALSCVRLCSSDLWNGTAAARRSLYHFNPSSKSRKRSRRRGVVSRRDEESCAELPDNVKLRDPSSAKVAALSLLGLVASQVSSPALARHPSSLWLITRHPALARCASGATVARQGGGVDAHTARGSCARAQDHCYGRSSPVHEPRRCSASRAASRLVVLPRALWCMERLLAALDRALHAQHAAHAHSLFAPAAWVSWGPL